jgi:hypothetical protein
MRRLLPVLGACALLVLAACDDGRPASQAAPTIIVQAPASDGGLSVLLTIALAGAFIGVIAAVVLGGFLLGERRRRKAADELVVELTGMPVYRARAALITRATVAEHPGVLADHRSIGRAS